MKSRVINPNSPFVRNHFQVDLTASEAQRFDDAVKKAGVFKARMIRALVVEWTDKQLGAAAPKASK